MSTQAPLANQEAPYLVYLLLWLALVSSGIWGLQQRRAETGAKGPSVMLSALIWAGLFAFVVLFYRGAWFWAGIANLIAALVK